MENKKEEKENNQINLNFPTKYSDELNNELKTSFWKCNDDSHHNSALHYSLIIPNNVKPTSLIEKNIQGVDSIKEIASYRRVDESPYLEVQLVYQKLEHEINPSDWQYNLLKISNEQIVEKREIKGKSGVYLDALTSKEYPNGEVVISRSTAQKNYDPSTKSAVIVSIKVSCSLKDYPELADEIMAIATGWKFLNKPDYQLGEDLKRYDTQKKNDLTFYFPTSWDDGRFDSKGNVPERFAVFNKNNNGEVDGAINVFVSKDRNKKEDLLDEAIGRYKDHSIVVELPELKETDIIIHNDYYNRKWESTGSIIDSSSNFTGNIRVAMVKTKDECLLVELVELNKDQDYYSAARNNRAFDLVLQTIQTADKLETGLEDESQSDNTSGQANKGRNDDSYFKDLFG